MTLEITIYQQGGKLYCESCKPRGGKRGTLVVGCYDQFCAGCGEDFLEMAEDAASLQEALAQPTLGPFTHRGRWHNSSPNHKMCTPRACCTQRCPGSHLTRNRGIFVCDEN